MNSSNSPGTQDLVSGLPRDTNRQVEELQERIAQLEDLLGLKLRFPLALGLTPTESRLLGLLLSRPIVSVDAAYAALYGDKDHVPGVAVLKMYICKLRRKLAPHGVSITNRWGAGYFLDPASKAALRDLIEAPE